MHTPVRTWFAGFYFDGQTPNRHPVTITVTPSALRIAKEDGSTLWWLYEQIRQTQGFHPGETVRFEKGAGIAEVVVVSEEGFFPAIEQIAPGVSHRFRGPGRRWVRLYRIALAAAVAVLIAAVLYLWGIPALSDAAASRVPVSWEERLGHAVAEQLAPPEAQCMDQERTRILDRIVTTLLASEPPSPYRFSVTVVEEESANAFAVPGGQIVLFHGLLVKAQNAEELAGVLAHEIEHIRQRHSLKALFRGMSLRAAMAVLTGNASGMGPVLEAAGTLGALRYQREDEETADRDGMKLVQAARLDPMGLVRLMRRLDEDSGDRPDGLSYLSTHPLTRDRASRLQELANQARYTPVPLVPDYSWNDMGKICDGRQ